MATADVRPATRAVVGGDSTIAGDTDVSAVAAVLADPRRTRMVLALGDGRALPASVLAAEAGVAASTASAHLARLTDAGLVSVERSGRFRYFRLAGPHVAELLEALARLSPAAPVRSLRAGTRAAAVRSARMCYDHLAGRLGTVLMAMLLDRELLVGGDGAFTPGAGGGRDRLAAPGRDVDYRLTSGGEAAMRGLGIDVSAIAGRRPLVRYCIDWSEQRHHLAGALGAAIARRSFELGWLARLDRSRAVRVTGAGREGLRDAFGLDVDVLAAPA